MCLPIRQGQGGEGSHAPDIARRPRCAKTKPSLPPTLRGGTHELSETCSLPRSGFGGRVLGVGACSHSFL